jgi:tetratricopeptide (TPR) repeat protein
MNLTPIRDPDDPARLRGLELLLTMDTPDEPADLCDELVRACPQLLRVQELIAESHEAHARGDRRKAIKLTRKAVALDPFHVPARGELAFMLRARAGPGDNTKALVELRRCIKRLDEDLGPDECARRYAPLVMYQVYRNTGNALAGTQDASLYEEAVALYRKAIAVLPTEDGAYYCLGRVLFLMGRMEDLCEHRKRTVATFPGSAMANYNYASTLEHKGCPAQELAKWYGLAWICARNNPSGPASRDADYPVAAARQWVRLGMFDKAQKAIDAALAIDPTDEPALGLKMAVVNGTNAYLQTNVNQELRMAQHQKRNRELGVAVDFQSLIDESQHDARAGTPMDSMHAVGSSQVVKIGAMVKITTTSRPHRNFSSAVALVSKGLLDGRVTLQVLPGTSEAAALAHTGKSPAHVEEVSRLRLLLAAQADVSSIRAQEGGETAAGAPRFVAKETTVRARPANLRLVCDFCFAPTTKSGQSVLRKCGGCKVANYCGKRCQKEHWKAVHKKTCKKLVTAKAQEQDSTGGDNADGTKFKDPPSWRKLDKALRRKLRDHHLQAGCSVPWPLTCEVVPMLDQMMPSFFCVHPNQRFEAQVCPMQSLRSGRKRRYMCLRESVPVTLTAAGIPQAEGKGKWQTVVPPHNSPVTEMMVLGECLWTPMCMSSLCDHYRDYPGRYFKWPSGKTIGTCPSTGKTICPDTSTVRLMVIYNIWGAVQTGGTQQSMSRPMPRIMTVEGYERLVGGTPADHHRCILHRLSENEATRIPFYPDFVQRFANRDPNQPVVAGGKKLGPAKGTPGESGWFYLPRKARHTSKKKGLPSAADLFQRYSEDLWEKDYERHVVSEKHDLLNGAMAGMGFRATMSPGL